MLERYLELSNAMFGAGEAQEWDDLVRIGAERDTIFASFDANLAAQLPPSEQAPARKSIERCLLLDAQIRSLAEQRQKDLRILLRVAPPVT